MKRSCFALSILMASLSGSLTWVDAARSNNGARPQAVSPREAIPCPPRIDPCDAEGQGCSPRAVASKASSEKFDGCTSVCPYEAYYYGDCADDDGPHVAGAAGHPADLPEAMSGEASACVVSEGKSDSESRLDADDAAPCEDRLASENPAAPEEQEESVSQTGAEEAAAAFPIDPQFLSQYDPVYDAEVYGVCDVQDDAALASEEGESPAPDAIADAAEPYDYEPYDYEPYCFDSASASLASEGDAGASHPPCHDAAGQPAESYIYDEAYGCECEEAHQYLYDYEYEYAYEPETDAHASLAAEEFAWREWEYDYDYDYANQCDEERLGSAPETPPAASAAAQAESNPDVLRGGRSDEIEFRVVAARLRDFAQRSLRSCEPVYAVLEAGRQIVAWSSGVDPSLALEAATLHLADLPQRERQSTITH